MSIKVIAIGGFVALIAAIITGYYTFHAVNDYLKPKSGDFYQNTTALVIATIAALIVAGIAGKIGAVVGILVGVALD